MRTKRPPQPNLDGHHRATGHSASPNHQTHDHELFAARPSSPTIKKPDRKLTGRVYLSHVDSNRPILRGTAPTHRFRRRCSIAPGRAGEGQFLSRKKKRAKGNKREKLGGGASANIGRRGILTGITQNRKLLETTSMKIILPSSFPTFSLLGCAAATRPIRRHFAARWAGGGYLAKDPSSHGRIPDIHGGRAAGPGESLWSGRARFTSQKKSKSDKSYVQWLRKKRKERRPCLKQTHTGFTV